MAPKRPILAEDEQRIKDELFNQVKHLRDKFVNFKESGLYISDEQIKENINKKLKNYLDAKEFFYQIETNKNRNSENIKKDLPSYNTIMRGNEFAFIDEKDYKSFLKECGTQLGTERFRLKSVQNVLRTDYKAAFEAILDPKKTVGYALNNKNLIITGYQLHAATGERQRLNNTTRQIISKNKDLFEGTFFAMYSQLLFMADPVSFLYNDYRPKMTPDESVEFYLRCQANNIFDVNVPEEKESLNVIGFCRSFLDDKNFRDMNSHLENFNKADLLYYKSQDPNLTLQEALIQGSPVSPMLDEEKQAIRDEFNRYDLAYIYNKLVANEATPQEKQAFEFFIKNSVDPNNQIFEQLNKDLNSNYTLDNFESEYIRHYGLKTVQKEEAEVKVNNIVNEEDNLNKIDLGDIFNSKNYQHRNEKKSFFNSESLKENEENIKLNKPSKEKQSKNNYGSFMDDMYGHLYSLQEHQNYLKENPDVIDSPTEFLSEIDRHNYILKEGLRQFHNNLVDELSIKDIENYVAFKGGVKSEENLNLFYKKAYERLNLHSAKNVPNLDENGIPKVYESLLEDNKTAILERAFESLPTKEGQSLTIKELITEFIPMPTKITPENLDAYFKPFENVITDYNKLHVPQPDEYEHPYFLGDKIDEGSYDNVINNLSNEAKEQKNLDLVEDLKIAKDILKKGKPSYFPDRTAEQMGKQANIKSNVDTMKELSHKEYFNPNSIKISRTKESIFMEGDANVQTKSSLMMDARNLEMDISKKGKENISKILSAFKNSQFNYKNGFDNPIPGYLPPQGVDAWIVPSRAKLEKAILQKDPLQIKSAINAYQIYEKESDDIYQLLGEIDPSDKLPANISLARNREIPQKYRNDIVRTSRFNSICVMLNSNKTRDLDFSKLVENPMGFYKEIQDNNYEAMVNNINDFTKNTPLPEMIDDFILKNADNFADTIIGNENDKIEFLQRTCEGISSMLGEPEGSKFLINTTLINLANEEKLNQINTFKTAAYGDDLEYVLTNAKRMMLVEQEDRDFFKLNQKADNFVDFDTLQPRQQFDEEEYFRTKTTPQNVALRAFDVFNHFSQMDIKNKPNALNVRNICKDMVTLVNENEKTPALQAVIDAINKNKPGNVTDSIRENLRNESIVFKGRRDGITRDNFREVMTSLAEMHKTYKNRWFFQKWFSSSVRKESNLIDRMYEKVSADTGISVKDLRNAVSKKNENNQNFFNTFVDNFVNQNNIINNEHLNANEHNNVVDENNLENQNVNQIQNNLNDEQKQIAPKPLILNEVKGDLNSDRKNLENSNEKVDQNIIQYGKK